MKYKFLTSALFLFFVYTGWSQESKQVLFLGNSYTAVNNLPEMVSAMAASTNDILIYDSYTPGGYRFMNHANDATSLGKIDEKAWDYVILQGQSQETAFPENQLENEIYPHVESLVTAIRANEACSIPLFYMTWGRKNGDPVNCPYAWWFCTYEDMDDAIRDTYLYMTETNQAQISPVGAVWRYLRENHPEIELYSGDESHPSLAGTYAAATAFYTMIFKKDPIAIDWNSSLTTEIAETIRSASQTVVFDQLSDWDYTLKPTADFSEDIQLLEVSFTNLSEDYEFVTWDFGDGNTSEETNPIHTYSEEGDYSVSLTAYHCDNFEVLTKSITVENLGIDKSEASSLLLYPNPSSGNMTLELSESYLPSVMEVVDVNGKIITQLPVKEVKMHLKFSHLNSGIYFLRIKGNPTPSILRFAII